MASLAVVHLAQAGSVASRTSVVRSARRGDGPKPIFSKPYSGPLLAAELGLGQAVRVLGSRTEMTLKSLSMWLSSTLPRGRRRRFKSCQW